MQVSVYTVHFAGIPFGDAHRIASRYFRGATLYRTAGVWQGFLEESVTLQVIGDDIKTVREFAEAVKSAGRQEAVYVLRSLQDLEVV